VALFAAKKKKLKRGNFAYVAFPVHWIKMKKQASLQNVNYSNQQAE
jgi:hypothetical protein